MAAEVKLVIDGAAMQELLRGPDGPVVLDLIKRADRLIALARAQIEAKRKRNWGPGTRRLARSIVKRMGTTDAGPVATVIAGAGLNPSYAVFLHEGNGPPGSLITPKHKSVLAFTTGGAARPSDPAGWKTARLAGNAVVVRHVRTSEPNRYLSDNLPEVLA